jgi:hypothetical protein
MKLPFEVPATAKPGDKIEVDFPGVVAEADVMPKSVVEQIVKDRLSQFAKGHVKPDELDAAAIQALAEKKGLKLAGSGTQSDDIGKQITQAKQDWTKLELEPVLAREQAQKSEVATLRRDQLAAALRAAGARVFKDVLLNPPAAGAQPPIVTMLEAQFGFNEPSRTWHVKAADGFAISSDPQKYGVYKTPDEAIADLAKNPAYKDFLRVETQGGPGLSGGGSSGGAVVVLTSEQAGHAPTYDAALAKVGGDHTKIRVADAQVT